MQPVGSRPPAGPADGDRQGDRLLVVPKASRDAVTQAPVLRAPQLLELERELGVEKRAIERANEQCLRSAGASRFTSKIKFLNRTRMRQKVGFRQWVLFGFCLDSVWSFFGFNGFFLLFHLIKAILSRHCIYAFRQCIFSNFLFVVRVRLQF